LEDLHSGHRQRLRKRFLKESLDAFDDHVVLELLLFYAIPQRDTNPIAHRLLKKFGSISAVLEASIEELCMVDGVGASAATLLHLIPSITRRYQTDRVRSGTVLDSVEKIGAYITPRFLGRKNETVIVLYLDKKRKLLHLEVLDEGGPAETKIEIRKIIESVVRTNATSVILSHNHAHGCVFPSAEDRTATEKTAFALGQISVDLIDHIIVSGNMFYSLREEKSTTVPHDLC
jgi:DNA repair protein RadC